MIPLLLHFIMQVLLFKLPLCSSDVTAVQCGPAFQNRCLCGKANEVNERIHSPYLVNCTNTGFTNSSVLQFLPPQTEELIFNGNNISVLPWNVFGNEENTNSLSLKSVDMSNNAIKEIKGKAFHHVASVETLILDHNDISLSSIKKNTEDHRHPRMFSNFINLKSLHLTNAFTDNSPENLANDLHDIFINSNLSVLIKLHLEQNELTGFSPVTVFCDLPALMDLHLGDNHLRDLHFNITCLHHLRFLDLRKNRITRLSKSDLAMLDIFPARGQPLTIDLGGNPLCDCVDLSEWLETTKVVVRNKESLSCNSTFSGDNKKEHALQHVSCSLHASVSVPNVPVVAESSSQSVGRGTVLGSVLVMITGIGLAVAFLYLKRVHFKPFSSLLDTVSRKVQYRTIGHNENEIVDV